MISIIVMACLVLIFIGGVAGCLIWGIGSIGVLLAVGFELGLFLMPIILIYLVARWVWKITTEKKDKPEKKAEE